MSPVHPCPACEAEIDVLPALDAKECPECGSHRRVLYALADGEVTHADLETDARGSYCIKADVRRELADRFEDLDDPADENQYLKEMGVVA